MYGILNDSGTKLIAKFTVPLTIRSNQPVFSTDALSLKRFISKSTAQRWEIQTNVEPLSASSQELMVNLVTKGPTEGVLIKVPQNYGAKLDKTATAVVTVATQATAGTQQIVVTGVSGLIPTGTFIKFGNHSKLYMLTQDRNNSGVINIFPQLRSTVLVGTAISYKDDVHINFLYDTDVVFGMTYNDGILMDIGTIRLIEKL
jgi:hypothetical protein